MTWADLHCHSQASDGSLSPRELVKMAKERGLRALSITDHDTTLAYAEAILAAEEEELLLGTGVEFSCVFEQQDIHLLGYDFDLLSPEIQALCKRHRVRRQHRNQKVIEKLSAYGMDISLEELEVREGTVGRPHIAQAMVQKGYVSSVRQAFHRYLGKGQCCYAQGESISVDETIDVIHFAQGKAFLAHPHLLPPSLSVDRLLQRPFDGIECWYAKFSEKIATYWIEIARRKGILMSGGSDFHGKGSIEASLGSQGISQDIFYQIFEHVK